MKLSEGVYLHLYHGRLDPDEQLEAWGFDGPTLGPLEYVHGTYASTLQGQFIDRNVPDVDSDPERDGHVAVGTVDGELTPCGGSIFLRYHDDLIIYWNREHKRLEYYGDFSVGAHKP